MEIRLLLVTAPSEESAADMAHELVNRRLIACANILPGIRSIYRWEGDTQDEREVLMVLKTRRSLLSELETAVSELHPYDVPEFISIAPELVAQPYSKWLMAETKQEQP